MKKLLSVILCISMLVSLSVPIYVSADTADASTDLPLPNRVGDYIYTQDFENELTANELVTSNDTSFSVDSDGSNKFITKTDKTVNTNFKIGPDAGTTDASAKTVYDISGGKCYAYEFDVKFLNKADGAALRFALCNLSKNTYHNFMSISYDSRKSETSYGIYSGSYGYNNVGTKLPIGLIPINDTDSSDWVNIRVEFSYGVWNPNGRKSIQYRIFVDNVAICDQTTFTVAAATECAAFANDFRFESYQRNSGSGTPMQFSLDNIKFYEISAVTEAPVTSITTSYTGETEQYADKLSEVTFTAKGNTTINDPENIKWYVNDELQSETGAVFSYTPPANVGNYNVYAEYNGLKSDATTIIVNEIEVLNTIMLTASGENEQFADDVSTVTFTAAGNIEIEQPENIKWYVNGELQSETGAVFSYTPPSEAGTYEITAEYDQIVSSSSAVTVIGYKDELTEDTYTETQNVFSHDFTSKPGVSAGDPQRFNSVWPQTWGNIEDPLDETNKVMYITSTAVNKAFIGPDKDVLFSAKYYLPAPEADSETALTGSVIFSGKTLAAFTYDSANKNYVISAGGKDLGTIEPNKWFTANFHIYRSDNSDLTLAWKYAKVHASFVGSFKNTENADASYLANTFLSAVTYDSGTWGKQQSPALGIKAANGTIYVDDYSITYPATLTVSALTPETYGEGYGMKLDGKLYISFNRGVDFSTASSDNIIVKDSEGNTLNPKIYGDASDANTIVADFKNAALNEYSTYSIEFTDGFKDVTGRRLIKKEFSFETQYDPSGEAFLKTLGFKAADSEDVTAVSGFSSSIDTDTSYNVSVNSDVASVTLVAEPVNKACTVTFNPADGIVDLSSGRASANVSITSPDGAKTVVHTINFSAYSGILTTSVEILPIALTLPLDFNYEAKLKTTVLPEDATNPALIFTSSDDTVATVDENGCITPVGIGNCTVTASAADNSGAYAQIPVTIIAANNYTGNNLLNLPYLSSQKRIDKAKFLSLPDTMGSGQIALWYNDTKAVWTHSADDSIIGDFDDWQDIYEQTGVPTTLFVPAKGYNNTAGGKRHSEMWAWATGQTGLDVQSHTYTHGNFKTKSSAELAWDYSLGKETIESFTNKKVSVVAYASGDVGDINIASKYHIAARGVYGSQNESDNVNYMNLNSISGCGNIESQLARAIEGNNWYCSHYHSIGTNKDSFIESAKTYATPRIEDGTLWATTIENAAMYGQERDTAVLNIKEFTGSQIKYELTDSMCDDYFYFPLTVKFYVPDNWISVSAEQNGSAATAKLKTIDGKKYVFVNAVPDKGEVVVTAVLDTSDTSDITVSASGGSITASVNGGEAQDWGSLKTDSFEAGTNINITASPAQEASSFMYWKDSESGLILSYDESYSFTVGSKRNISAVYIDNETVYVTFKNANGRIVSAEFIGADSKVPENPYLYGYTFDGWYKNGGKTALAAGNTMSDTETTIYSAGFTKSEITYTVTVNGAESSYKYNDKVSLTADEQDSEGKSFNYWMRDGKIVSYSALYSFFVAGNTTVTAVYGETSVSEEIVLVMSDPIVVDSSRIAFFAERSLPETCTVIESGILMGTKSGLDIETAPIKAISKDTNNKGQFTVRKANANDGATYYGRAYVIYSDADGVHTIYSNEVSKAI